MIQELPVSEYRKSFDASEIGCSTTETINPTDEIIGQRRATRALDFGLNIEEKGFNIYASGVPGTGRKTTVEKFLKQLSRQKPKGKDWVYVNNFSNQYEPRAIELPAGKGKEFKRDMGSFIEDARRAIPKAFESEDYASRREDAIKEIDQKKTTLINELNAIAREKGFILQPGPQGLLTIPAKGDQPLSQEDFLALPENEQAEYQKKREELSVEMRSRFRKIRDLDQEGVEAVKKLNSDVSSYAIGHLLAVFRDKYAEIPVIIEFIEAVQKDIIDNLPQFLGVPQEQQPMPAQFQAPLLTEILFRKYEVNVIVDNSDIEGAPVVFEQTPSYPNLLGKIEKEFQYGIVTTDFTMIRPGSLHKANGGYLVLPVEDLFRYPFVYDGLKTALKTQKASFEEPGERLGYITAKGLKPEPIPLNVKVILIGTPYVNQILYTQDPEFSELFKIKAEFDTTMDRDKITAEKYARFVCTLCTSHNLKHLDKTALARVVEYGSRLAEDQQKLSTRFSFVADIIREANYYANIEKEQYITAKHIERAIEEKIFRSNLIQEKVQDYIRRGIYLIETDGANIGQVNGLSVIGLGDIEFGRPSRVTASISLGKGGIMDIEREASMGGPIHTKGVLILSGYLSEKYGNKRPMSLSARLVFEQSYSGVEGDSASSTELYAILSALSGLPISQSIAVTGSVNQKGEVQAIGGVNEKLEGFFEVCKAKGLNGKQGAMIPASNVQNLMLKEEIVEAAKAGKFRIFPVKTIDEGIEVLTGVSAGERKADGSFEKGTVNYLVDKRLLEMAETMKEYQGAKK